MSDPLTPDALRQIDAYWRASNYLEEEGTTITPFDMVVLNKFDHYQLALDAIRRIPMPADRVDAETARYETILQRHKLCIGEYGDGMPEVRDWRWAA